MLVKYWIYVVALVLLLVSIRTPVVAYEVCYMAFFVVLIAVLQVSKFLGFFKSRLTFFQFLGILRFLAHDALRFLDDFDRIFYRGADRGVHLSVQRHPKNLVELDALA